MREDETPRERTERILDTIIATLNQFDDDRIVCVDSVATGLTVAELRRALRFCRRHTRNG